MSLIQQALEKTNRANETRTTTPVAEPPFKERDLMGATLEQELTQVQERYSRRRSLYRKIFLGVLAMIFIAGISYALTTRNHSSPVPVAKVPVFEAPLRITSGEIFRLTGITSFDGKPMAVINGRIVGEGASLSGKAVVRQIGNGEVRLDVQGQEIRLLL